MAVLILSGVGQEGRSRHKRGEGAGDNFSAAACFRQENPPRFCKACPKTSSHTAKNIWGEGGVGIQSAASTFICILAIVYLFIRYIL